MKVQRHSFNAARLKPVMVQQYDMLREHLQRYDTIIPKGVKEQ